MFLMYFLIALLNGVLTYKIRQIEKEARKKGVTFTPGNTPAPL